MRKSDVKKVLVFDQGLEGKTHPVFFQLMAKAKEVFGEQDTVYAGLHVYTDHPETAVAAMEQAVREYQPQLLLIGATALGEEAAPALGICLETGVAAHCIDIRISENGRVAYMVPAFGGKVIGEIFIPEGNPAIASIKPGTFAGREDTAGSDTVLTVGELPEPALRITAREESESGKKALDKTDLVFCGGFGIGSEENWKKLEKIAAVLQGAAGCTRPVVDMGWGPDEYDMIGTSGRTIRPKVYVGFGISGAAHHLCGIRDAGIIISINNDKEAEVFAASDYKGVLDAQAVIDSLLEKIGGQ